MIRLLGKKKKHLLQAGGLAKQVWSDELFFFRGVAKMTLKTQKHRGENKNQDIFCRRVLAKYFGLFSKIFRFWSKTGLFCKILEKFKNKKKEKNLSKRKILVSRASKTVLFIYLFIYLFICGRKGKRMLLQYPYSHSMLVSESLPPWSYDIVFRICILALINQCLQFMHSYCVKLNS